MLKDRSRNEQFYQKLTSATIRYLLVIFCIVTLGLFILMMRELRRRINTRRVARKDRGPETLA